MKSQLEKKKKHWLKVQIPKELNDRLASFCQHKGRKSHLVRTSIEEFVTKLEISRDIGRKF